MIKNEQLDNIKEVFSKLNDSDKSYQYLIK